MTLNIIYTETDVLLSKRKYSTWREIQDEYKDYKASLEGWSVVEVVEYLQAEYSTLCPSAQVQIQNFLNSDMNVVPLSFTSSLN